jgi:hypothetical protein
MCRLLTQSRHPQFKLLPRRLAIQYHNHWCLAPTM